MCVQGLVSAQAELVKQPLRRAHDLFGDGLDSLLQLCLRRTCRTSCTAGCRKKPEDVVEIPVEIQNFLKSGAL